MELATSLHKLEKAPIKQETTIKPRKESTEKKMMPGKSLYKNEAKNNSYSSKMLSQKRLRSGSVLATNTKRVVMSTKNLKIERELAQEKKTDLEKSWESFTNNGLQNLSREKKVLISNFKPSKELQESLISRGIVVPGLNNN